MADYCSVQQAKDQLGGQWGGTYATGSGSDRDGVLKDYVTTCSRLFDRETGHPTDYYAAGTNVTRRYSGSGRQFLDIDDWDAIMGVVMTSNQQRTDIQTLTVSDPTSPNFVEVLPLQGPPFNQLFLLRSWLPDVFNVGNIAVTGSIKTPAEVSHAVAVWAAYKFLARNAGWADIAQREDQQGATYRRGIPPEVQEVLKLYRGGHRGPKLALVDGGNTERTSKWLGWQALDTGIGVGP